MAIREQGSRPVRQFIEQSSIRSALQRLGVALVLTSVSIIASGCGEAHPDARTPAQAAVTANTTAAPTTTAPTATTPGPAASTEPTAAAAQTSSPLTVGPNDPTWGSPDALVTVFEFADLQCPFSARAQTTLFELQNLYGPNQLRIVWKNNPLPFHNQAMPAHQAAMAVHRLRGDAAFWQFVGRTFANQSELKRRGLDTWASEVNTSRADITKLAEGMRAKIGQDMSLAKRVGASGTPAFRINGVTVSGAQPLDKFREVIDDQLREAKDLLAEGVARNRISTLLTERNLTSVHEEPEEDVEEADVAPQPAPETVAWAIPVFPTDPQRGPSDALVTIVEFSDFECPFCQRVEPTLERLQHAYPEVRLVWKDNPLPFHKQARNAANFARHLHTTLGNAAFWQAHDALFLHRVELGDAMYQTIARDMKAPWRGLERAMTSDQYNDVFRTSQALARDFGANGTPSFFINGHLLSGAQPYEKFEALVVQQLAVAKALVEQGTPKAEVYAKLMAQAQPAKGPELRRVEAPNGKRPTKGPTDAKVVVTLFTDFECPFCERVNPTLVALQKHYPRDVKLEYRYHPLPFHTHAELAAEAAVEVFEQKGNAGFWKFHDLLFKNQRALERADLKRYAAQVGVDVHRFDQALDDHRHQRTVRADVAAAEAADMRGTPAFLINGYYLSGARSLDEFKELVDRAKREAGVLPVVAPARTKQE